MNSEGSKRGGLHEILSNFSSKTWFASNLSIYYTLENINKTNKNNKFKI